LTLSSFL